MLSKKMKTILAEEIETENNIVKTNTQAIERLESTYKTKLAEKQELEDRLYKITIIVDNLEENISKKKQITNETANLVKFKENLICEY